MRVGIIDFNPDQNPDTIHYVKKISALLPKGVGHDGIPFRNNVDYSKYDALILTGSKLSASYYQKIVGQGSVTERDYLFVEKVAQKISKYDGPMFGICFGAQLMAYVMGGKIGRLPHTEAGYLNHKLTAHGKADAVFGELPDIFFGAHMHNDYVGVLPKGGRIADSKVLARRNGFIHAYRVRYKNGLIRYGVQPHPEMSTPEYATFFVKKARGWLPDEIGKTAYEKALRVSANADFHLSETIARFIENTV